MLRSALAQPLRLNPQLGNIAVRCPSRGVRLSCLGCPALLQVLQNRVRKGISSIWDALVSMLQCKYGLLHCGGQRPPQGETLHTCSSSAVCLCSVCKGALPLG